MLANAKQHDRHPDEQQRQRWVAAKPAQVAAGHRRRVADRFPDALESVPDGAWQMLGSDRSSRARCWLAVRPGPSVCGSAGWLSAP